jgi:hypothetical protein
MITKLFETLEDVVATLSVVRNKDFFAAHGSLPETGSLVKPHRCHFVSTYKKRGL